MTSHSTQTPTLQRLERLWNSLTRPSPELTKREEREVAYLLSSVELALLLGAAIILPLWIVTNPNFRSLPWITMVMSAILLIAYLLGRGKRYRLGGYTLIAALYFVIAGVIFIAPGPMPTRMLALDFLSTAILLGSLFMPIRTLVICLAATVASVAAFLLAPEAPFNVAFSTLVSITVAAALIVLVTSVHRSYVTRLEASEQIYYALFEQSHDAVFLLDLRGVHLKANRRAAEMLGYSADELAGLSFQEIVVPSEHPESEDVLAQLAAGRRVPMYERTFRRKDGTPIPVEISVELVRDRAGQPLHIQSIVRDLTERQRHEAALRDSEAQLKSIMESMQEMVWSVSLPEDRIRYANPYMQRTLGLTEATYPDNPNLWLRLVFADDQQRVADLTRDLLSQGQGEAEFRAVYPDGSLRWLHVRTWLVRDASGAPLRADGLATDITERKLAQEQAFALAVEKERVRVLIRFVQSASHELRTPLSTIGTSVYLLTRVLEPDRRQTYVDQIQLQIARLSQLIDKLLVMTELDNATPLEFTPIDLNNLVRRCVDGVQKMAAQKEITLSYQPATNLPRPAADWDWLEQAVDGIVDNAVRYTPEGGSVTVLTCARDAQIVVEVRDSGPGIREADLPHIFERFWRADEAHSTPGFGLGLPIAQEVIRRHGGCIEIDSTPGQGSTFRIVLPVTPPQAYSGG